jgi:hypothetical protein
VATAPDAISPPCLLVGMPTVDYHQAQGGMTHCTWPVFAILPRAHDQAAVDQFDIWLNVGSVRGALELDVTLGGAVQNIVVTDATPQVYAGPNGDLPCYRFDCQLLVAP